MLSAKGSRQIGKLKHAKGIIKEMSDDENINLEMRPKNIGSSRKHPFGKYIPRNYFCHFRFDLDPEVEYDVAVKKFFYSWERYHETIDI